MIDNKIYKAIIGEIESREASGSVKGNGHHLAQLLTRKVSYALLSKGQQKVVNAMFGGGVFESAAAIAEKCGMKSSTVSATLLQINKKSCIVSKKKKEGKWMWGTFN